MEEQTKLMPTDFVTDFIIAGNARINIKIVSASFVKQKDDTWYTIYHCEFLDSPPNFVARNSFIRVVYGSVGPHYDMILNVNEVHLETEDGRIVGRLVGITNTPPSKL